MSYGSVGLIALAVGCVVAVAAIVTYEAWWTIAFAFGGAAVAIFERRGHSPSRSVASGVAIGGALVLAGMALFLLYGSLVGGGAKWFVASVASAVVAVLLVIVVWRRRVVRPAA
jgi:hypothetical protein